MMEDEIKDKVTSAAETLLAIELLDYHNRNFLADGTSPKKLSGHKKELIQEILDAMEKFHPIPF